MKKIIIFALVLTLALSSLCLSAFAKGETNYASGITVDSPAYLEKYNGNLTDGQIGGNAYDNLWAGFYHNEDNADNNYDGVSGVVVVDFGEKKNAIDSIEAHIWDAQGTSGIGSPESIKAYASVDGENYAYLGDLTFGAETIDWATLTLETPVNAQYIKYEFVKGSGDGVFMFVSELAVYGTPDGTGTDASELVSDIEPEVSVVPDDESAPADESVPADESKPATESAPADDSSASDPTPEPENNNTVLWVVLGVVAAVVVVAIIVVVTKKKK